MKWEDPIVKEVRDVRDRIAAEHGYNIAAISRFYQEKQQQEARKTITLPPQTARKQRKTGLTLPAPAKGRAPGGSINKRRLLTAGSK